MSAGARPPDGGAAPLDGLVVLDFSELLPGPFMTQSLAELGATVIRVERPPHGDALRRLAPTLFAAINRGKQSFQVDLREPDGRARVLGWLAQADVLVESYRPGVMGRHGLDFATLHARHPRLVYVSLSGYGQDGPNAGLPGHDANYLAAAGVLALSGSPEGPPQAAAGVPLADLAGATYGLAALMAALYQRERTGLGQHLDVALSEAPLHWMNPRVALLREQPAQDLAGQRSHLARAAYGVFACRDGGYLSIAALEDHFWARLAGCLDMGEFGTPVYASAGARREQVDAINRRLADQVRGWEVEALMAHLTGADVPAMPVRDPLRVHEAPQHLARGLFAATDAGPLCRFPVRLVGMPDMPTSMAGLQSMGEPCLARRFQTGEDR